MPMRSHEPVRSSKERPFLRLLETTSLRDRFLLPAYEGNRLYNSPACYPIYNETRRTIHRGDIHQVQSASKQGRSRTDTTNHKTSHWRPVCAA